MNTYNIVNGDNLKALLKDKYTNILVMREALCQGPIQDENFFENRALFISEEYEACSKEQYLEKNILYMDLETYKYNSYYQKCKGK